MTCSFRVSTFLCLLGAFIWQIGIETQWAVGSHAEEEEKKFNIVFGNLSFKSTLPPSEHSVTTKETPVDNVSTEGGLVLTDDAQHTRRDSNVTEYDDLRHDVSKNDASPENSVDREALEESNNFYKDNSKLETSSVTYDEKESSTALDSTLSSKTPLPDSISSQEDADSFQNSNCSVADSKCKMTSNSDEHVISPRFDDKTAHLTSSVTPSSVTTPLWNIVKSVKQNEQVSQTSSLIFTPFRTTVNSDIFTTNTESSTTIQTSENVIPVEGSVVNKLDSLNDTPANKTEKSKSTKLGDILNTSDDRTFSKILSTTPISVVAKTNSSDILPSSSESPTTTLISKIFEAVNISSPIPTDSQPINVNTSDLESPKLFIHPSSNYDFNEKDLITPSSVLHFSYMSTDLNSDLLPFYTTSSWNSGKSTASYEEAKKASDVTPSLLPSFRESSLATEMIKKVIKSSSEIITSIPSYTMTGSLPDLLVSTQQPELNNGFVPKDTTPIITTDKEEHIPPPRWTNPGCSSLPMCIEITLPGTTWDEFCSQAREFQEFLSKAISHIIHKIHPHQIVLEAENCVQSPPIHPVQPSSDVTVALFVTDDSGEYAEKLTEICALILRKWAPTTFRNSDLEVRLFNTESQSTSIPVIPELNSGFVAAVSISAVAGVALCMLCILLVVMKQKILQSRSSETASPAADAYSLDSLSINASFRRRRNRKSARSYLNHAFSDQEIPSHPLNEKTLQNCLRNRELLEEEFKKIPMNMPKLSEIPEGAHVKNRYSNILPKPETRVVLADPSGDPLKCYINANYVKGYGGKPSTYIACQAPLPEGIEDFWRMIWEQQCRVIIMLTMFEENGTSRCAVYFPQSTLVSHPPYGDFQVSLLKKDVYEFYTMSTLRLLDIEKNLFRDVVHLWYTNWPDVGVPKDPTCLITFVQQCRSFINCNAGPTVVHCSTGTGRTGVFLALDICTREYDESRSIDILQCVSQLRRDRGGAVQNKDQYILIQEAILEYISRMANQSQRSSIQS